MAGRPRSFDRDAALDVALDAFWRSGYEQTSIAGLTEAIGINPPSLYAAFGTKDELFCEAADLYLRRFREGVLACLEHPDVRIAIADLLEAAARAQTRPGTPPGCLVMTEPRLRTERDHMRDQIADRLRRAQAAGDLPAGAAPEALAGLIEAVLVGMSARARDGGGYEELRALSALALASLVPAAG